MTTDEQIEALERKTEQLQLQILALTKDLTYVSAYLAATAHALGRAEVAANLEMGTRTLCVELAHAGAPKDKLEAALEQLL